jgi:hypothetical protein
VKQACWDVSLQFLTVSSIDVKSKMSADVEERVDCERYKRLVGKLIYLYHTRPDNSFTVSVMSCYMYDPKKGHTDAVSHILRYMKSTPGKGLIFMNNGHMNIEGYYD